MTPEEIPDFMQPYAAAGHDLASLFDVTTSNRCKVCGAPLINLAEDLVYGDMRECKMEPRV